MIMKNAVAIYLVFISFYSCAKAHQTYGLCSQFYQMYQYCTNASATVERVATTVVERKIGKKGPKGDRGDSPIVNYTAINSRIDEKVKDIEARVDEFESDLLKKHQKFVKEAKKDEVVENVAMNEISRKISSLSSTLEEMSNKMQRVCPIFYNKKCFVPVMIKYANHDEARDTCAGMLGKLADIYDMDHLDLIMKQVRENNMNGKSKVDLRLGMKIQPSTGQVFLTDGTKVTYLNKWFPGYPNKSATWTSVILQVRPSATSVKQYLFNTTPASIRNILCEI